MLGHLYKSLEFFALRRIVLDALISPSLINLTDMRKKSTYVQLSSESSASLDKEENVTV